MPDTLTPTPTSKGQLRRAFWPVRSPGMGPILPANGQKRSGRNSSSLSMSARSHLHVRISKAVTTLCLQSPQNLVFAWSAVGAT